MKGREVAEQILIKLGKKIRTSKFRNQYFENQRAFQRKRKLPLDVLISFLMERSTKSYDLKISDWVSNQEFERELPLTKQAVSKARQKIPAKLFEDIFYDSSIRYLQESTDKKTWNGYQVLAVDATDFQIPTTEETKAYFGEIKGQHATKIAGASSSTLCDVLNGVLLSAVIKPFRTGERVMAKEVIDKIIAELDKKNTIIVFDRGYPGYEFLEYLTEKQIQYVIRIKEQMTLLRTPGKADGKVYRKCGKKCREIRTIEVELDEKKREYLITNLPQERVLGEKFKELYHMRWGIEGKYRELKSQLEIEAFSGKKVVCIEQDFYITMFLANIVSLVKNETDECMRKEQKAKRKSEYQANRGYLIHQVNGAISRLLLNSSQVEDMIRKIIDKGKKIRSQIRRNRKCERDKNLNRRKYCMTYKSCI